MCVGNIFMMRNNSNLEDQIINLNNDINNLQDDVDKLTKEKQELGEEIEKLEKNLTDVVEYTEEQNIIDVLRHTFGYDNIAVVVVGKIPDKYKYLENNIVYIVSPNTVNPVWNQINEYDVIIAIGDIEIRTINDTPVLRWDING